MLTVLLFIAFAGCASLKNQVFQEIHEGDSKEHLVSVLGQPDQFGPSSTGTGDAYYYLRGHDRCGFRVQDNKITKMGCDPRPGYLDPVQLFGLGLQGAGEGMQNASKNSTNCYTQADGYGNAYTHCD